MSASHWPLVHVPAPPSYPPAGPVEGLQRILEIAAQVPDPEIPVITIADLGILRGVRAERDTVVVTITPTYAGCPAMHAIEADVMAALAKHNISARVETVLQPAWTTDWMTNEGREKLRAYGIAPPQSRVASSEHGLRFHAPAKHSPTCPRCGSKATERLSQFGSTACKALYRCTACKEPFDYFKSY